MGIPILNELQDRLHTIAIAGTNLLSEDFRLKKTAEQFHSIAISSPVLSKIDQLVQQLYAPENTEKEISLIEAITLVDAVVCTQAEYSVKKEEKQEITVFAGGNITDIKYSELEPMISALTTKGSGRYEIVNDIYQNKKELLKDFRIFPLLIKGLNDSYSELVDLIEKILIEIGENVIPLCKKDFDAMGGKDMVRRLNVLVKVAKDSENDFYVSLLENSSAVVKEKAILNLGCFEKNIDLLIHLAETEKGKYKTAALTALSELNIEKSITYLFEKAKKKPQTYLPYLVKCDTEEVSDAFAEELEKLLQELLSEKDDKSIHKLYNKIKPILCSINYKCSDKMIDALQKYGDEKRYIDDINWKLINSLFYKIDEKYIAMIKELYKRCGAVYLPCMLVAEFLTEPEKTYDLCLPYFYDKNMIQNILKILTMIKYENDGYYIYLSKNVSGFVAKEMDIRWIDFLTQVKNDVWQKHSIVVYWVLKSWINYNDEKTIPLFRRKFREFLKHITMDASVFDILKKLGETDFRTLVFSFISKQHFHYYDFSHTIRLLKELPFTEEDRKAEAKMILGGIEKKSPNSRDNLVNRFKEDLKEIIGEGKEV